MKFPAILFVLLYAVISTHSSFAQGNKPPSKSKVDSTKRVVLQAKFGPFANGSDVLAGDFKVIAGGELKVIDSTSGTAWTVVKFRLGWRRRELSDDIKTGKKKVIYNFNATDVYDSNKIPLAWQNEMKTNIQPTEEVLFESIYVQHPTTKRMMECPPITLKIK